MTHLLLDVDSTIPNLALMRISSWLKSRGEDVKLVKMKGKSMPPLDFLANLNPSPLVKVWISCVFTWNRKLALGMKSLYEWVGLPVEMGGTGISLRTKLPDEIEAVAPDYGLYLDEKGRPDDRAIGFVQRGCIRRCLHCVVPIKEGRQSDNPLRPIEGWVPQGYSKVLLLDNEFAACPYEERTVRTAKDNGWRISITQGYDVRCVTPEKAAMYADWKPMDIKFGESRLYIAWDYFAIGPRVRQAIQTLLDAGFRGREIMCYVLVGKNTSHLQDYARFHVLWKEYGVMPFLMRYNLRRDDRFLNCLARYSNRGPASYRNHSFLDYCAQTGRGITPEVRDEAKRVVDWLESGKEVPCTIPFEMPDMGSLYD